MSIPAPVPAIPAAPTLWRTCRALANRQRLLLLRYLVEHPYRQVSDVACALHMPLAVASQYLRALNARGMLRAARVSTRVFYRAAPDPSIAQAGAIINALIASYKIPKTTTDDLRFALTGFTHPRRIQLIQELARGARTVRLLASKTGASRRAVLRHMDKLWRRGYVERRGYEYRIRRPLSPMKAALLKIALRRS